MQKETERAVIVFLCYYVQKQKDQVLESTFVGWDIVSLIAGRWLESYQEVCHVA